MESELDPKIVLPNEINLEESQRFEKNIDKDNSEDDTLLLDFDEEEARREREKVNHYISELRFEGLWR